MSAKVSRANFAQRFFHFENSQKEISICLQVQFNREE